MTDKEETGSACEMFILQCPCAQLLYVHVYVLTWGLSVDFSVRGRDVGSVPSERCPLLQLCNFSHMESYRVEMGDFSSLKTVVLLAVRKRFSRSQYGFAELPVFCRVLSIATS